MQTLALSVITGMLVAGLVALYQIPLNKKRVRQRRSEDAAEFNTFTEALAFLNDPTYASKLPSDIREREIRRKQLISNIKDRMRIYESRKELDELEKSK